MVHVKKSKFSTPRIPLVISSQRVDIRYHNDPHGQCKRVTWPFFISTGLGLPLGAKLVSTDERPSIFSIIYRLFPNGGENQFPPHFLHDPVGRAPRHVCRKVRAKKVEDLTCLCSTLSRI